MAKNDTMEITDFDAKPLTASQVMEMQRLYMDKLERNVVELAGTISKKFVSEPRQKVDKQSGEPVLLNGEYQYWPARSSVTLDFVGGNISIGVESDWFDDMQIGDRVLFTGRKGLSFGSVNDVFHSYVKL